MKTLLIGRGFVGKAIAKELYARGADYEITGRCPEAGLRAQIDRADIVINAAGYTGKPNVDACETDRAAVIRDNVLLPPRLAEWCGGKPLVHVSSGCIFYGDDYFSEWQLPNFDRSFYSWSKIAGERALSGYPAHILRIRMPFTADGDPRCVITKLAGYPKWIEGRNSMTYLPDAAKACIDILQAPSGIYNCVSPDPVNNSDIARYLGVSPEWWDETMFHVKHTPRSFCTLSTAKIAPYVKLSLAHDIMRDMLKKAA